MSTPLLAIDPGNKESAVACFDEDGSFILSKKMPNEELLEYLRKPMRRFETDAGRYCVVAASIRLAIEGVACYGMAVGAEVFDTVLWSGRFIEAFRRPHTLVYRLQVKMHLCHTARANDSNIRQAIIDLYGGKEKAIGNKKNPGPLYGVAGDEWAAIGVGLTWLGTKATEEHNGS